MIADDRAGSTSTETASRPGPPTRLLLAGILLVSAALRLTHLGTLPGFNGDEGLDLFYARQVLDSGVVRLHPVRPYLGPYQLWLMLPFVKLLGVLPVAARLVPAMLGVVGTWLGWRIGRRWGGEAHGLVGAALLAFAPWFVGYSRMALSVSHMPAMVIMSWWLFGRLLDRTSRVRAATLGLALGASVVFHPTGLLLVAAVAAAALVHPGGRACVRRPGVLLAGVLGFVGTGWVAWKLILAQVGLGPGVDLSLTAVDQEVQHGLVGRLVRSLPILLETAAGSRTLHWLTGIPGREQPLLFVVQGMIAAAALAAVVRAMRERDRNAAALIAATVVAFAGTVVRSAHFDLEMVSRERYLLVPVTLLFLLVPYGVVGLGVAPSGRRLRIAAAVVGVWLLLDLGALHQGFFGPLRTHGGQGELSNLVSIPDAKLQAARYILEHTSPEEEGLLLAGDGWTYWSVLCFLGERMPADFVPEDPAECAATLGRTAHRRRFLVDYSDGHWGGTIRSCLEQAGHGDLPPVLTPLTPDGRPILDLWELPPER